MSRFKEVAIGEHIKLTSGFPFPSSKFSSEGFPLIRIRDILTSQTETYFQGSFLPSYIIKKNNILIGMDGDFHVARWNGRDALLNQRVLKVDVHSESTIVLDYLFHWLGPFVKKINETTAATTVKHLSTKDIIKAKANFPDVKIQQKIATILTAIDTTIQKTEVLIAKFHQLKAGLMHDLFTRGVLPNGQLRPTREQAPELYQKIEGEWIPRDWQYDLLDRLASRGSGHTPNKNHPEYWNGGVKWVSLADSHKLDQLYIADTELKISHKGIQNSSAVLHPAGVVVLSRDAGVGKSAITTEPMAVSQHFMCWKCDKKMNNHFLYYWLQFQKRAFENIAMGSTILTIGLPYFKRLKIACPIDIGEQVAIAERLKSVDSQLFSLQNDLFKKKQQKLGLMQDLLTGKVQVKVDEPEPAHA
ncbi:type I restriction enzyme S subunit [Pseudomonas sp. GGS8]|uniref:restriction endonuclease subunit S n=1 Tax=Pseudomonas sp. GGS8 TaxID=2817892 RepID=UPI0020A0C311|nr:restriction endonuclease subunit S [Pseudomonas sp. GGS8]MCP1441864.1 type I restriction enzyme S subunit [Pseudomonas sp. GGS8]